jgi:RNA polymerase sigma factor, sigma-70 family
MKKDFSAVFDEYGKDIYRYVLSKVRHRETAEDITQDVFLNAFRSWENYTDSDQLRAWLFKIAHNAVLRGYANRTRVTYSISRSDDEGDIDFPDFSCDPENDFLRKEAVERIMRSVEELSEVHQVAFRCRYIEDMSLNETAEYIGLPIGTVKSRVHYAVREIKKSLGISESDQSFEQLTKQIKRRTTKMMTCNEIKAYFSVYAAGTLSDSLKKEVEAHAEKCDECNELLAIVCALTEKMNKPEDGAFFDYYISLPEYNLIYASLNPKSLYASDENGNVTEHYMRGMTNGLDYLKDATNNALSSSGKEYPFEIYKHTADDGEKWETFCLNYAKGMENETAIHLVYSQDLSNDYTKDESGELSIGTTNRNVGDEKSGTYVLLDYGAHDVKIIRGSGIINIGGGRKFAYTEGYVPEEDTFRLKYSYKI